MGEKFAVLRMFCIFVRFLIRITSPLIVAYPVGLHVYLSVLRLVAAKRKA